MEVDFLPGLRVCWATTGKYGIVLRTSLHNVISKYMVTYDSKGTGCFEVHKPNEIICFNQHSTGLYIHDTNNRAIVLLNKVDSNRAGYSDREYHAARKARRIYEMIGYPSTKDYHNMIEHNLLGDMDITLRDITNAQDMFGPSMAALKGKPYVEHPNR